MRPVIHKTREAWLNEATELFVPLLLEVGQSLPEKGVQVSVGFPRTKIKTAIGVCHSPGWTKDGVTHIFISPVLGDTDERILDVLLHELVHATVGCEHGHKAPFKKVVRALGLEGKVTATYVTEGSELHGKILTIADKIGRFPHSVMSMPADETAKKRKPGGGWIKLISPQDESYILRISAKALSENGPPSDPWGNVMTQEGEGGSDDEGEED